MTPPTHPATPVYTHLRRHAWLKHTLLDGLCATEYNDFLCPFCKLCGLSSQVLTGSLAGQSRWEARRGEERLLQCGKKPVKTGSKGAQLGKQPDQCPRRGSTGLVGRRSIGMCSGVPGKQPMAQARRSTCAAQAISRCSTALNCWMAFSCCSMRAACAAVAAALAAASAAARAAGSATLTSSLHCIARARAQLGSSADWLWPAHRD